MSGIPHPFSHPPSIVKNAAECRLCGDVVESTYQHDWKECKCGEIFVDGGRAYIRRGAKNLDNIIDRSEFAA